MGAFGTDGEQRVEAQLGKDLDLALGGGVVDGMPGAEERFQMVAIVADDAAQAADVALRRRQPDAYLESSIV